MWFTRLNINSIADDLEASLEAQMTEGDKKLVIAALFEVARLGAVEGLRKATSIAAANRADLTLYEIHRLILSALPAGGHQWGKRSLLQHGFQCQTCGVYSSHTDNEAACIATSPPAGAQDQ